MGLRIVILGAPGSGKGTQAQRIHAEWGIPHISTGDIFRQRLEEDCAFGRQIRPYMESGSLVPDELTCAVVAQRLAEPDCAEGYILDGFPRTAPQATELERLQHDRGDRIDVVLDLEVPDEEIVNRLTSRRLCPTCGAIYSLMLEPEGKRLACDRPDCGSELVQRADDNEATIRHRLEVYHSMTEPLIRFYRDRGTLRAVPSAGLSPDAIFDRIEAILDGVRIPEAT